MYNGDALIFTGILCRFQTTVEACSNLQVTHILLKEIRLNWLFHASVRRAYRKTNELVVDMHNSVFFCYLNTLKYYNTYLSLWLPVS